MSYSSLLVKSEEQAAHFLANTQPLVTLQRLVRSGFGFLMCPRLSYFLIFSRFVVISLVLAHCHAAESSSTSALIFLQMC